MINMIYDGNTHTGVGPDGGEGLGQALKYNSVLEELRICDNNLVLYDLPNQRHEFQAIDAITDVINIYNKAPSFSSLSLSIHISICAYFLKILSNMIVIALFFFNILNSDSFLPLFESNIPTNIDETF
jgi:hypothetical protein